MDAVLAVFVVVVVSGALDVDGSYLQAGTVVMPCVL